MFRSGARLASISSSKSTRARQRSAFVCARACSASAATVARPISVWPLGSSERDNRRSARASVNASARADKVRTSASVRLRSARMPIRRCSLFRLRSRLRIAISSVGTQKSSLATQPKLRCIISACQPRRKSRGATTIRRVVRVSGSRRRCKLAPGASPRATRIVSADRSPRRRSQDDSDWLATCEPANWEVPCATASNRFRSSSSSAESARVPGMDSLANSRRNEIVSA